jgi:hypothetical protein
MDIVKEIVVKEGYEQFHNEATIKLSNLDAEIEQEVALYRESVIAKKADDRVRLQNIIGMCTEEREVEMPDVEETEGEEQVAEDIVE